jgi:nicotinamidase-related amidase
MSQPEIPAFVADWYSKIESASLKEIVSDPESVGLFSADMINGFLRTGALAAERVNMLTEPVVSLFTRCWELDVREFLLLQDTHDPETPEFNAYPPHAIVGTEESATIPELSALPFADRFTIIEKNSLNPAVGTIFDSWLAEHEHIKTALVVGNCTDLCVYQLAMHLRLRANAHNLANFEVVVPEDCVNTFDTPTHPADYFHRLFLYHMASNGIRIVRALT